MVHFCYPFVIHEQMTFQFASSDHHETNQLIPELQSSLIVKPKARLGTSKRNIWCCTLYFCSS
ncbi:hypothetical protein Scep_011549 [Stephania cephalantha]|uniref:Uncharacterized protein n=1 Tax=Stephania cephalantha TaxID=152367 RepID=A0AAP0JDA1_9MAGN